MNNTGEHGRPRRQRRRRSDSAARRQLYESMVRIRKQVRRGYDVFVHGDLEDAVQLWRGAAEQLQHLADRVTTLTASPTS